MGLNLPHNWRVINALLQFNLGLPLNWRSFLRCRVAESAKDTLYVPSATEFPLPAFYFRCLELRHWLVGGYQHHFLPRGLHG